MDSSAVHLPPQLDTVDYYKVVRGISPNDYRQRGPLVLETISSDSNNWSLFYPSFSSHFHMAHRHSSPIIISEKGLVHVSGTLYNGMAAMNFVNNVMLIFDESKEESLQVMDLPPTESKRSICEECIGQSEGSILYARNEAGQLKIWRMGNYGCSGGWSLIHNVSVKSWFPQFNADTPPEDSGLEFIPKAFHPTDQNIIFLIYRRTVLVYDIKKSEVNLFCDLMRSEGSGSLHYFFPYTCGLMGSHLFLCD